MTTTTAAPATTPRHISVVRDVPANENGRGNLAGFEAKCPDCAFVAGHTFRSGIDRDAYDHWAYMARKAGR